LTFGRLSFCSLVTFIHLGVLFEPVSGSGLRAMTAAYSWVTTSKLGTGREPSPT
jgi:hypothetical protein